MIYLSGAVRPEILGRLPNLGVMMQPAMGNRPDLSGTPWAADNGCFSQGTAFNLEHFMDWLLRWRPFQAMCLFAVAPDVVGDARSTWARSADVLPRLRALGYPAALVAQDGIEDMLIDWSAFDVLFMGGTTRFKLSESAYDMVREGKRRGKWTHQGRCNSFRRLRAAHLAGYDSADGTYIAFGPDRNLPRVLSWLGALQSQAPLMAVL